MACPAPRLLAQIAKKYGLKLVDVIADNPQFEDPSVIFPGEEIYLPCKPATSGASVADLLSNRPDTRVVLEAALAAGFGDTLSGEWHSCISREGVRPARHEAT